MSTSENPDIMYQYHSYDRARCGALTMTAYRDWFAALHLAATRHGWGRLAPPYPMRCADLPRRCGVLQKNLLAVGTNLHRCVNRDARALWRQAVAERHEALSQPYGRLARARKRVAV